MLPTRQTPVAMRPAFGFVCGIADRWFIRFEKRKKKYWEMKKLPQDYPNQLKSVALKKQDNLFQLEDIFGVNKLQF